MAKRIISIMNVMFFKTTLKRPLLQCHLDPAKNTKMALRSTAGRLTHILPSLKSAKRNVVYSKHASKKLFLSYWPHKVYNTLFLPR